MADRLVEIWQAQQEQQAELGMDPRHMNDVDRRRITSDLVLQLHEEASELGRIASTHKRHLLSSPRIDPHNVSEEIADILKTALVIAQLHGLTVSDVVKAFHRKTRVVRSRADGERMRLQSTTRLLCVDMDDVISDLGSWGKQLAEYKVGAEPGKQVWDILEAHKDEFYQDGRFRDMPPIEGAPAALRALKARGWTIVIVTARPQWQYKRLYADTLEWLDKHEVPHDHVLFNKDKVEAVHSHLAPAWPRAFIEDHERNARALADAGIPVLLFDRPHNQGISDAENLTRVSGWDKILEALSE